jgi:hypothetical protein
MYTPVENRIGIQPIAVANVPNTALQSGQSPFLNAEHPLGTIIKAFDPIYGESEFIYLQMVASTVVGSAVTWNGYGTVNGQGSTSRSQFQTALAGTTANQGQPVGFAMAAFPSGSPATAFGWFQIAGNAVAATNGTLAAGPGKVFLAASGTVTSTQANGVELVNAINVTATGTPAANQAIISINRPFAQGQVV